MSFSQTHTHTHTHSLTHTYTPTTFHTFKYQYKRTHCLDDTYVCTRTIWLKIRIIYSDGLLVECFILRGVYKLAFDYTMLEQQQLLQCRLVLVDKQKHDLFLPTKQHNIIPPQAVALQIQTKQKQGVFYLTTWMHVHTHIHVCVDVCRRTIVCIL